MFAFLERECRFSLIYPTKRKTAFFRETDSLHFEGTRRQYEAETASP
jgi:hypothetical protein